MSNDAAPDRKLNSWKEIAEYLGVTVRTAQSWEAERGMPVHRLPGGRGPVHAVVSELDAWKAAGGNHSPANGVGVPAQVGKNHRALLVLALGFVVVFVVAYVVTRRHGPPLLWHVDLNTLIVSDAKGRELWRKSFGVNLVGEVYERSHPRWKDQVWFGDLDGDGKVETLFSLDYRAGGGETGELLCLSEQGEERWRFVPGKPVTTRKETFSTHYRIRKIIVARLVPEHPKAVLVVSYNYPDFPTQVAILSVGGALLREYWHSGYIGGDFDECVQVADLNRDGKNEIYLGGVNNAYQQATLVVLDPETMSGASVEENHDYQLQGFEPGREIGRVLFPRSCLNKRKLEYNGVIEVVAHDSSLSIAVVEAFNPIGAALFYDLDPDLRLRDFRTSDDFRSRHRQQSNAGELDHQWSAQEEAEMHKIRVVRSTDLHVNSLAAKKE